MIVIDHKDLEFALEKIFGTGLYRKRIHVLGIDVDDVHDDELAQHAAPLIIINSAANAEG